MCSESHRCTLSELSSLSQLSSLVGGPVFVLSSRLLSVYINYPEPPSSTPYSFHYSPHLSFSRPPTISVVFHPASAGVIIISLRAPHRFLSPLCAASHRLPSFFLFPTHHQLNKPSLLPSLSLFLPLSFSIINRFGLRGFLCMFLSAPLEQPAAMPAPRPACTGHAMRPHLRMITLQRWRDFKLPLRTNMMDRDLNGEIIGCSYDTTF